MPEAADSAWELRVEAAFAITGRGTAVVGTLEGVIPTSPVAARLQAQGHVMVIPTVSIELTRVAEGDERMALLLWGVAKGAVPEGSVVRSLPASRPC